MCLRLRPRSPRPPSWLNRGSLLLRDGEGKGRGEKRRKGNWKGREAWEGEGREGKGKEGRVGPCEGEERDGKGREIIENVARGRGRTQNVARGPQPP